MPGARMNSPFASRSRSACAFALPVMSDPRCGGAMLAHLRERKVAISPAAVLLRSRSRDGVVAVIARSHRAGRKHADLVLRREDARHRDLRAVDPDADRLVAGRARSGARADPASGTTVDSYLQLDREGAAVL